MTIYFLADMACGLMKIGFSGDEDPKKRVSGIQTSSPHDLTLLGSVQESDGISELELHARFAEHRVRGEWFRMAPEVVRGVAALLNQAEVDGLIEKAEAASDRWVSLEETA